MATGDFNHDGKLDVAINPGSLFMFPVFNATPFIDVYLAADVNADGRPDVLVDSCVLLNDGPATVARSAASRPAGVGGSTGLSSSVSPNPVRGLGRIAFRVPSPEL